VGDLYSLAVCEWTQQQTMHHVVKMSRLTKFEVKCQVIA